MTPLKSLLVPACAVSLLFAPLLAAGDDSPAPAAADRGAQLPALSATQQRAVGIVIAAAPAAQPPQRLDAYGRVLDPSLLVADAGLGTLNAVRLTLHPVGMGPRIVNFGAWRAHVLSVLRQQDRKSVV